VDDDNPITALRVDKILAELRNADAAHLQADALLCLEEAVESGDDLDAAGRRYLDARVEQIRARLALEAAREALRRALPLVSYWR